MRQALANGRGNRIVAAPALAVWSFPANAALGDYPGCSPPRGGYESNDGSMKIYLAVLTNGFRITEILRGKSGRRRTRQYVYATAHGGGDAVELLLQGPQAAESISVGI